MILHRSVSLERPCGPNEPGQLVGALRELLGGEPLRWAITAVDETHLHVEVSFRAGKGT